jgi:16S rRNA (cytosine1407-C5)-methyltransferase
MRKAVRLWPHIFGTTGFFSARFTKQAPIMLSEDGESVHSGRKLGRKNLLSLKEQQFICNWIKSFYGFDLEAVLQTQRATLMESGNGILLVPERLFSEFTGLPLSSFGLNSFKRIPDGFQISHEYAARFGHLFKDGIAVLDEEQSHAYWKRQDIFNYHASSAIVGETLLAKDESGRVLGRAKALKDRLKNLLPPRLY